MVDIAFADSFNGAFRQTGAASDAVVGNEVSHCSSLIESYTVLLFCPTKVVLFFYLNKKLRKKLLVNCNFAYFGTLTNDVNAC